MSIKNFDRLANPIFLLKKLTEIKISQLFPHHYCSHYRAVFYSEHSYEEAKLISEKNEKILDELTKNLKSPEDLDIPLA